MPLFDFVCGAGHRTERRLPSTSRSVRCPACGRDALRQFAAPQIGGRARAPQNERAVSLRTYREATEQLAYEHARNEESAQRPLEAAPLWQEAKRKARVLEAAGIKDSLDYDPRYGPK